MTASPAAGLTSAEVARRVADGGVNDVPSRATRSAAAIIRANIFTRINAILAVLFVIVPATGSSINGLFGLAKPETEQTDQGESARQRQTSPPEEPQEATRIAALLHDRFGTGY
jgi:cation-transporting P-type ATPase E